MKRKCPQCCFDEEFKKGKVPFFFTFSLLDSHVTSYQVKKNIFCPKYHSKIKLTNYKNKRTSFKSHSF